MRQNLRASRLRPLNYSGFVVDLDIVTSDEAETDPFYVNCLRKYGGGVGTGTVIPAPSGDLIIFNIERSYKKGFVDRDVLPALDALRPHLARSALLSLRLGLERARAMTEALARLELPAAVLGGSGRVLSTNTLLDRLDKQFIVAAGGRLAISYRPATELFERYLVNSARGGTTQNPYSIPIPVTDGCPAAVAHLLPVCRQARDIFPAPHIYLL